MEGDTMTTRVYRMKAYLFVRFSSGKQREGTSVERQTDWATAWCQRKKIPLDDSLALTDPAASAFKGHQRRAGGPLDNFIQACEQGRVARGSYLLVENLDRLSREHPLNAFDLVRRLIMDHGIILVTIHPECEYRADNLDMANGMMMFVEFARGHSESAAKSFRSHDNWTRKRAKIGDKILTSKVPAWCRVEDGKILEDTPRANVVRSIFDLATKGYGFQSIALKLTRDKVKPIGTAQVWHPSYIEKILKNRAVLGEYQPCKVVEGRKVKAGPPVPGYYPTIIGRQTWDATHQAIGSRRSLRGMITRKVSNLFTGVVFEKNQPMAYHIKNHVGYLQTTACLSPGCRYDHFEKVLLYLIREVRLTLDNGSQYDQLSKLEADQARRVKVLESRIDTDPELETLLDKLSSLKRQLADTRKQMEMAAVPLQSQLLHSKELIEHLDKADEHEKESLRREVRQTIRLTVRRIDVQVKGEHKGAKTVLANVTFKDGTVRAIKYHTTAGRITGAGLVEIKNMADLQASFDLWAYPEKPLPFPVDTSPRNDACRRCNELRAAGKGINEIAGTMKINRTTVYRYLNGRV